MSVQIVKKYVAKVLLILIGFVLASSLIVSGTCNGPIDSILNWRDKTGCGTGIHIPMGWGNASGIGFVTMFLLLLFGVFFYVLFRLWKSTFK